MIELRPPIVRNTDRDWSLAQCPVWAVRTGSLTDAAGPGKVLNWDFFVADQVERFEAFFAHERKAAGDWSRLWRKSWWPKADPAKLFPRLMPKAAHVAHPFFRAGTDEFKRALAVATVRERWLWQRIGVAQFTPSDTRVARVINTKSPAKG